ncbi:MAG: aminopeptidase N [Tatlockia sp.]|nr:aminopeptidase N [Tatlockia sp.]
MPAQTIYRKDYQAPSFNISTVDLDFDLFDTHAIVINRMQFKRQAPGALHLFGDELELISISMDSKPLDKNSYRLEKGDLFIDNCPDAFELEITTRIEPQNNTQLSGLYRSNHLFCTQCEAEGFRRISFYLDRPDVLAKYKTKIRADKADYPVLLSNGNLIGAGELENGRHWVQWEDPFKKPSYLFALVAGQLAFIQDQFVTTSGKTVDLRIYVEPGNEDKCGHAMESLKKAMRWDEEVYGLEYDLTILMIVAVSDFNMGAMENKGLNVFNSKYILARPDTATDQDFADVEGVVGHEYFHNWTGNRITCRDWFQLSLKEGLTVFRDQEFSRDMNSRDVNRIADVKVLRNAQFPEDAGAMAHPVRPEAYQEINNFYTATVYNKGAEVIRMQNTLLGKEGFRRGMDLYFERHDGHAVTIDDFVAAMEDANQVDFKQLKLWYSQAGTPEVQVSSSFEDDKLTLTMTQSCRPTAETIMKKPFHIPIRVALFSQEGQSLTVENDILELKETQQSFSFTGLKSKPIVSLLGDFSAPIKLNFDQSEEDLLALLSFEKNGFAKWDASQRLVLNCLKFYLNHSTEQWQIPPKLVDAFRQVLEDESLDQALRADLLTPPGFEDLASTLDFVDVDAVENVRDFFRAELGKQLYPTMASMYKTLWQKEDHGMYAEAFAQRKLRNLCLWFMMKADETNTLQLCQEQFSKAKTMTDQIASFSALNNVSQADIREEAVNVFYRQWSEDELVLDKWFSIQACSENADTLSKVKELLNHPAFSIQNPNKVRALIGAFCQSNLRQFHAANGSGYAFLTEMLILLDKINPQIASRLATPFTRLHRFDASRQKLMTEQLTYLEKQDLSRDLREIVEKSLKV